MKTRIRLAILAATAGAALTLPGACGSGAQNRPAAEAETEPRTGRPCCVSERWTEPPPEIGETPPERAAPADALAPFVPEREPEPAPAPEPEGGDEG